ncbi:MAG TPA: hypothetical protein VN839_00315, partial [Patescibacteria group bacterium]|nr:hypothetical protein [Patescibacteria group bacterium]
MADPIDPAALIDRARRREEDGDDRGAIADFEQAVRLAQESGDASVEVLARAGLLRLRLAAGNAREV